MEAKNFMQIEIDDAVDSPEFITEQERETREIYGVEPTLVKYTDVVDQNRLARMRGAREATSTIGHRKNNPYKPNSHKFDLWNTGFDKAKFAIEKLIERRLKVK